MRTPDWSNVDTAALECRTRVAEPFIAAGAAVRRSHAAPLLMLGCCAVMLAGCGKPHSIPPPSRPQPASVKVRGVEKGIYQAYEEAPGTVRSRLRAAIEAKVSGRIETVNVVAGQEVQKGEQLAKLEVRDIEAQLEQAKALRDQAIRDRERTETLFKEKVATQQEYDAVRARFRVSDAQANEAQTRLGYATITAPFAGVITRKLADIGDLATPGRTLFELENPSDLRLEADLPEALIERVKLKDKLRVRAGSQAESVEGVISEIAPIAEAGSRTFRVKIDLPASARLRAGQFGRAIVPVGESANLRVPASALVVRGQMEIVFVAAGQKAQLRLVKTGRRVGQEIEILSGLEAGEQVVVEGATALMDGQRLEVKP